MIGRIRLGEGREASIRPVEFPTVHDHTANSGAVPTNELGGRVNNDITAMLERLHQIRGRQCVIQDEWDAMFMRNIRDSLNIQSIEARVAYCLGENRFGALINSRAEILGVAAVDESNSDA